MVPAEPRFDNPFDGSKLSLPTPVFSFPAEFYGPNYQQISRLARVSLILVFLASFVVCFQRSPVIQRIDLGLATSLVSMGISIITTAIILRPLCRLSLLSEAVSTIGLLVSVLVLISEHLSSHLLPTVGALVLIWGTSELSHHWVVINLPTKPGPRIDARYVIATVGSSIVIWASKDGLMGPNRVSVTILSTAEFFTVALLFHHGSGYRIQDLLRYGFAGFYGYPDSAGPGVIAAPSGHSAFRPLPAVTFLFVSVGVVALGPSPTNATEIAAAFACAIVLELAIFTLVVVVAATPKRKSTTSRQWDIAVSANARSSEPIHRNSIYVGKVAFDGSPVQLDRSLVLQHVHFMGATGEGKSSMGIVPLIEQLGRRGDASIIALDLKGDTFEIMAALDEARSRAVDPRQENIDLKVFSTETGRLTHAFNPFLTNGWMDLSILERTDVITSALGLNYGSGYGPDFFTSCNSVVIESGNRSNPDVMSLRQLHSDVRRFLGSKAARDLMPDIAKTGFHAVSVLSRMALLDAINVTGARPDAPDVLEHRIDLANFFTTPTFAYFHLPSTTSSIAAPAIARLACHFLLVAGKKVKRKHKVYVAIDEFQLMASHGLEMMFQMARGLDVGFILANQSMGDLIGISPSLANTMEENCHWRQWFTVKTKSDLELLEKLFGTKEEVRESVSVSSKGRTITTSLEEVPRMTVRDLLYVSNDPYLSIAHIVGDRKGFGQYSGLPFVVRNDYHISEEEFAKRKGFPWPDELPGMFPGGTTSNTDTRNDASERDLADERERAETSFDRQAGWGELFE